MITEINSRNFDEQVLRSELPVLACFVAPWCHSCFSTCLLANNLAEQYAGKMKFVKVDVEKSPEIQARYHIIALPSIIFFHQAQPLERRLGYQEKTSLRHLLDTLLTEGHRLTATAEPDDRETRRQPR